MDRPPTLFTREELYSFLRLKIHCAAADDDRDRKVNARVVAEVVNLTNSTSRPPTSNSSKRGYFSIGLENWNI
jgi:hypothetical protein